MSRLDTMRRRTSESLTLMRTFCLRPTAETFARVKEEPAAKRLGPLYDAWVAAAVFKFGFGDDPDTDDYIAMDKELCDDAVSSPSLTVSLCVLYMFYATGELKYIDLFYQCIGNHHLPTSTRVELSKEFRSAKTEYLEYLADKSHPPLVDSVRLTSVDFSYFDGIKETARAQKLTHHPLE